MIGMIPIIVIILIAPIVVLIIYHFPRKKQEYYHWLLCDSKIATTPKGIRLEGCNGFTQHVWDEESKTMYTRTDFDTWEVSPGGFYDGDDKGAAWGTGNDPLPTKEYAQYLIKAYNDQEKKYAERIK